MVSSILLDPMEKNGHLTIPQKYNEVILLLLKHHYGPMCHIYRQSHEIADHQWESLPFLCKQWFFEKINLHQVTLPLQMNMPLLSKGAHNERPHDIHSSTTTKLNSTTVDEFKYGFPSHGLSSISYKWWGIKLDGGNSQQSQSIDTQETQQQPKSSAADAAANSSSVDVNMSEIVASLIDVDSQWTSSLTALRKRAVEDGRKSLKFGVYEGYGVKNLDRAQKMVLHQIFKSPLPGDWENLSSED